MKILFCDDDSNIGDTAKKIFLRSKNDFIYTNSVTTSKLAYDLGDFDVVIIDIVFKGDITNGFDILRHIIESYKPRPKIFMTSSSLRKFAALLEENKCHIDGTFHKPEELLALLNRLSEEL